MRQRWPVLLELELAKPEQCPGRAEPRRKFHDFLESQCRFGVLIRPILQHAQVPPALFPIWPHRERTLDIADRLGILPVLDFGGGSSLQLLKTRLSRPLHLTRSLRRKNCGETQYEQSRPRGSKLSQRHCRQAKHLLVSL